MVFPLKQEQYPFGRTNERTNELVSKVDDGCGGTPNAICRDVFYAKQSMNSDEEWLDYWICEMEKGLMML